MVEVKRKIWMVLGASVDEDAGWRRGGEKVLQLLVSCALVIKPVYLGIDAISALSQPLSRIQPSSLRKSRHHFLM